MKEIQYKKALETIAKTGRASIAHFQRWLGVGYMTASEIVDLLERRGVVGPQNGLAPREVHLERVEEELGSDAVAALARQPMDDLAALNKDVIELASAMTESAYQLIESSVGTGKDLYQTLVSEYGEPIRVMFKLERQREKDVVVGGELQFKGTDILAGLIVSEDAVNVNGIECGGSKWSFGDCDENLSCAIVAMFVMLYGA